MTNAHPNGCDDCGLIVPLFHNEATEASLCEDCDRAADERNAHKVARRAATEATRKAIEAEAEAKALRAEAMRLHAIACRAELWAEAKSLRMRLEAVEARAARVTATNPRGDR